MTGWIVDFCGIDEYTTGGVSLSGLGQHDQPLITNDLQTLCIVDCPNVDSVGVAVLRVLQ